MDYSFTSVYSVYFYILCLPENAKVNRNAVTDKIFTRVTKILLIIC